jgi:hypothetical protein
MKDTYANHLYHQHTDLNFRLPTINQTNRSLDRGSEGSSVSIEADSGVSSALSEDLARLRFI